MTAIGDYCIIQDTKNNRIIISLPQTLSTAMSTALPIRNRRLKLTENEEAALLVCVKAMFENERGD